MYERFCLLRQQLYYYLYKLLIFTFLVKNKCNLYFLTLCFHFLP